MNAPGSLVITVDDHEVSIELVGGGGWRLPIGPVTLVDGQLEHADRPSPEQLTNALGIVTDHLDDVVRESAMVLAATSVSFTGEHSLALARVELGTDVLPETTALSRADADEVFRTLVAEPVAQRVHNPGLDPDDVETVIGTCCVVLAVMRRLDLAAVSIVATTAEGG